MGDLVNLRQVRKAKARTDKSEVAAVNRAAFGRTKAERITTEGLRTQADRRLDGARREPRDGGEPSPS